MAGFLDDVGKFFDNIGNNNNSEGQQSGKGEIVDAEIVGQDIDGVYTGSKRIITIPGELK